MVNRRHDTRRNVIWTQEKLINKRRILRRNGVSQSLRQAQDKLSSFGMMFKGITLSPAPANFHSQ